MKSQNRVAALIILAMALAALSSSWVAVASPPNVTGRAIVAISDGDMLDAGTEAEAASAPSFTPWGWTNMCSSCNRRSFLAKATAAMAGAAAGFAATVLEVTGQQPPNRARQQANSMFMRQSTIVAHNVRAVGYSDLDARPAFKMSIREHRGWWYLYTGHFWHSGWSIIDVTDPSVPHVVRFIPGPANTWTLQMELSGSTMITALEQTFPGQCIAQNYRRNADGRARLWTGDGYLG